MKDADGNKLSPTDKVVFVPKGRNRSLIFARVTNIIGEIAKVSYRYGKSLIHKSVLCSRLIKNNQDQIKKR